MIGKVLIATDGSASSEKAVRFGSDLAAKCGADVVLVHVLLRPELSEGLRRMAEMEYHAEEDGLQFLDAISRLPEARFPAIDIRPEDVMSMRDALRAIGENILAAAERVAREAGVAEVSRRLEDGDPVKRILEVADEVNADVIVTGARGLSDLKALMIGSVSHKLSHLSPVTCVTVR